VEALGVHEESLQAQEAQGELPQDHHREEGPHPSAPEGLGLPVGHAPGHEGGVDPQGQRLQYSPARQKPVEQEHGGGAFEVKDEEKGEGEAEGGGRKGGRFGPFGEAGPKAPEGEEQGGQEAESGHGAENERQAEKGFPGGLALRRQPKAGGRPEGRGQRREKDEDPGNPSLPYPQD